MTTTISLDTVHEHDRTAAELSRRLAPPRNRHIGRYALAAFAMTVILFLTLPALIVVPMSFSDASSLEFPPPALSLRWYRSFFSDPQWLAAMGTSVLVAAVSSTAALILGSLAAYGLVRGRIRGRAILDGNFIAPMILPHIITAVALYMTFARIGLLGSLAGLILSHTIISVPYVVLIMSVAIRAFDIRLEQVAYSLGAGWLTMFSRVLAPNLIPSFAAAWIFAFITSFDEVTLTVFLSGTYETLPEKMFNELREQVNPTITAVATILIAFSVVTVGVLCLLMRRQVMDRIAK
jgi:ABC-type spermidine/putrescine transport system permease subunit II